MRPAKPMNSTMRPNRAGFAKLKPRPPNSCFATTMATKAPMMAIHSGMVAGRLKARIMPVTTAEKSPTGTGFFITTQYSASKPTQARDQQCPRAENKRAGHQCGQQRDAHVEHKPPRAGMVGDMGGRGNDQFFAFHRYFFPPFLFFCHTALARFIVCVTGRLAGHT